MKLRLSLLALAFVLSACGGGGGDETIQASGAAEPVISQPAAPQETVTTPAAPEIANTATPQPFSAQFSVFDDFQRADTLAGDIGAPTKGSAWKLMGNYQGGTFAAPTVGRISNGMFVVDPPAASGNQASYALQELQGTVSRIGATFQYVENTGANQGTATFTVALLIAPQEPEVKNMIHFTLTRAAWNLELWSPDGTRSSLVRGTFSPQLELGKPYSVNVDIAGDDITLTIPGATKRVSDARISSHAGKFVTWEHFTTGPTADLLQYVEVWATDAPPADLLPLALR